MRQKTLKYERKSMPDVYYLNSHYKNQKESGVVVEVKTVADLEDFPDENLVELYQLIVELNPESIAEVNCGLGQNLANIHNLTGKYVSGCTDDTNKCFQYGNKHFNLKDKKITMYPSLEGKKELVFCANYNENEVDSLINSMIKASDRYVVLVGASEDVKEQYEDYQTVSWEDYPNLLVIEIVEEEEEDVESEEQESDGGWG